MNEDQELDPFEVMDKEDEEDTDGDGEIDPEKLKKSGFHEEGEEEDPLVADVDEIHLKDPLEVDPFISGTPEEETGSEDEEDEEGFYDDDEEDEGEQW